MALSQAAIDRAHAEIFARWLRFIPETEALAQADNFARRAGMLASEGYLTEAELDQVIAIVATEMADSGGQR